VKSGVLEVTDISGKFITFEFSEWGNDSNEKSILFEQPIKVTSINFIAKESYGDIPNKFVSAAEFQFMLQVEEGVEPDRTILIDTLLSARKKWGENNNEVKSIISEFNLYDKYN
ncbi:hypothetical protein, partial [Enterococcus faecalis]